MRANAVALITLVASVLASVAEDRGMTVDYDKLPSMHFPIGANGKSVAVIPAFEDYAFMMFDACDAMHLTGGECAIFPMNADLDGNAIATILGGNPVIVYDRTLSQKVGYEGAMAIMAHELGHHYCRHLGSPPNPLKELEADRFAGAAMRNAGMSLENALAMAELFDGRPSRTHPAKGDRVAAIKAGWKNPISAKDCRR
ncbi:M48 family metalloprotease [Mesorhizobium japonicum]|nr:M48 family metalloprotease [Mesorhizobium japonicum]